MSRRLPATTGQGVLRVLERAGFYVHHTKGSHHSLRHPAKPELRVVVPVHKKDLPLGTLRSIIKQAGLSEDEFIKLL
jgi:predicted RNA binding protein YcfA (HicA-like mRNA interferase family)